jgi:nucleotide-binding universal stress UspA family protein
MARAAKLVGPDAEIEALFVLKVPRELKLQDGMDAEEELGRNVLEVARLQARARHLKVRAKLIRTRNPGKAIVREATERHSDLIYISTDHAPSDERLLGPTARHVLANRPCRVVVEGGNGAVNGGDGRTPKSAGRHTAAGERSPQTAR